MNQIDWPAVKLAIENSIGLLELNDRVSARELATRFRKIYCQQEVRNRVMAATLELIGDKLVIIRHRGIIQIDTL